MSRTALFVRRSVTLLAVAAAVLAGLFAIRVAAAWTADNAPLEVTPVAIGELQGQLLDERSRSAMLVDELDRLETEAAALSTALDDARDRISADHAYAGALQADLGAAKEKLRKLEAAIAKARAALARQPATVTVTTAQRVEDRDDHDDEREDEEDEEHEDD